MLFQVVLGKVADPEAARRAWEGISLADLTGWFGSAGGVTTDGRLVLSAAFESPEAAEAAGSWWSALEGELESPTVVLETEDVAVVSVKPPTGAGFVQLMRAAVRDRERLEAVEAEIGPAFIEHRPDFLEGNRLWFDDGTLVALDYFSSEAEARAGEAKPLPEVLATGFQQWFSLLVDPEWYDLTNPWIAGPAR